MDFKVFVRLADREDHEQPAPFFINCYTDWTAVKLLLSSYYEDVCDNDLDVRYWDEEDFVIISSQEELDEALRLSAEEEKSYLQLYVRLMDTDNTRSKDQQPSAGCSPGTAVADDVRGKLSQERKESGGGHLDCSMSENSQPSELPKAEKPQSLSDTTPKKPSSFDSMIKGEDLVKKLPESGEDKQALLEAAARASERTRIVDYLLKDQSSQLNMSEAEAMQWKKDRAQATARRLSRDSAVLATLQEMITGGDSSDEGHIMEQTDEEEVADRGRFMLPGALSGANVIAIEMPEMEHQGTESAEPAEIAETGEVTTKSSRDAETGFWMQPQLEAEVKAELRRKLSTLVTERERTSHDRLQQKKHERRASRVDSGHKKKKHRGGESVPEESVSDFLLKGRSSTSLTNSSPLDVVSEEASSSTPPPLHKSHERRSSKSEGKKKKHASDLLTEDAFVRYMTKFELHLKKDVAKEVAKKTVRSVIKNFPKQAEASETARVAPAISSQRSGFAHDDIICDCCDREIVGTRYICGNCPNYDLCEECEDIQPSFHDRTHVFIKLRRPCLKAGTRHGVRVPLLKRIIYETKDEERKVDPGRIQVIMERTKGQETQAERRMSMSRNNNNNEDNEEGDEGGLNEQRQDQPDEEYQMLEKPEKVYEVKATEVKDSVEESSVSAGDMMENAETQENAMSPVTENAEGETDPEPGSTRYQPRVFHPTELMRHIIAGRPMPRFFTIKGVPGLHDNLKKTCEGRVPKPKPEKAQPIFQLKKDWMDRESATDPPVASADDPEMSTEEIQPKIFHPTELMRHICLERQLPPVFVIKGLPGVFEPYQNCDDQEEPESVSAVPEASRASVPEPEQVSLTGEKQTTELEAKAVSDEEDDDLGPEVDDLYPECVEDGFVVCSPTQGCFEEQVRDERATSPASSIEVVNPSPSPDMHVETVDASQQTLAVEGGIGMCVSQGTHCQEQQTDYLNSLSSLIDESSSDEDFVIIVPDCFDITKPLDPASLLRLNHEKSRKRNTLGNQSEQGPGSDIPPTETQLRQPTTGAGASASGEEIVHLLPQTEGKGTNCTPRNLLGMADQDPSDHLHLAEELPDPDKEKRGANEKDMITVLKRDKEIEGIRNAGYEEADVQEEGSSSLQEDIPPATEASSNQLEACAAVDHPPQPSREVQASENQSHSSGADFQDPEDSDVSDVDETDLKCPPESDEEGAAAASDSSLDPNQQLNEMVTNTFKKASNGLQQLLQTGKDIFKTLQRGDSYEPEESSYVFKPADYKLPQYQPEESSYVFKPADYKLPESTWQPSHKEFVMPKSNFKLAQNEFPMPKTTYSGPQAQASSGVGGEFSGPLRRIREMGYFNNERTLALLREYEGDVEKVVNDLIEETDNDWAERRH